MNLAPRLIENEFVRLEPLDARHREALRPLADDKSLWTQSVMRADGRYFDAWFEAMLGAHESGAQISHAVFDKLSGGFAGHTAYLAIQPAHARVEIGWTWYAAKFHRTHVNPACKHLLMENAFGAGAERVELKTGSQNLRSQGAMTKMGATREGVLRSHTLTWTGERRDTVYFSVLEREWPYVKAGLETRLSRVAMPCT
ncbi:N-acetyltransferase [Marinicauda algicola]|uniref:N-acetyltransferase n=1 Tax=Marinicauda algicola TaxID=2029849 RepID=A0A4S2GZ38_9PROT|nr:GNAT family protein [Marinicauda algicola]TGY88467.1 N-acetyltransferase [Marinicauda algicola]